VAGAFGARKKPAGDDRRRRDERGARGDDRRPPRGDDRRPPRGDDRRPPRAFEQADRTPVERPSRRAPEPSRRDEPTDGPRGYGDDRYVYGINPVLELLRGKPGQIDRLSVQEQGLKESIAGEIFSRASAHGIRVDRVDRVRLDAMAPKSVHQGVVAEVRQFDYSTIEQILAGPKMHGRPGLIVMLDGIQDPMNLGAIIRSAHALGADGIVIAKDRAAAVTGVVAKASAGATAHTKIARVTNLARALEELKAAGYWSVAAEPTGEETLWSARLDGPITIVVGAEGSGVRRGILEHCDYLVRIPMIGQVASLNASVSAAVLLAEVARRRQPKA